MKFVFSYFRNLYNFPLPLYCLFACTFSISSVRSFVRSVYTNITPLDNVFSHARFSGNLTGTNIFTRSCIRSIVSTIIIKRIPRIYLTRLRECEARKNFQAGEKKERKERKIVKKKKKRETFPENFSYLLRFLLDFSRMIKKIFKKYSLRSNFFFVSPFKIIYKKHCTYAEFIRDRVDYYLSVIFWDRNVRKIIGDVQ